MIKRMLLIILVLTTALGISFNCRAEETKHPAGELWPETQPYKTGYLKVSEIHEIYYQLGGNPEGKPVMALHGGPGAMCSPYYFRYFNPQKFHVILHDQRGAGKSKPYAELKENNTQNLVEDIERLRKHLKLGKVILFGGSWGSTLALAYAETYPENVSGMVLRGIFTAARDEIDHFYHGGTAVQFPLVYKRLVDVIPYPDKKNFPAQLLEKLTSPDPAVRDKYAKAWARYETKLAHLDMPDERVDQIINHWPVYAFALLENHYMANECFLEDRQLLNNAHKIKDIPIIMVNGRFDVICPPRNAYRLKEILPKAVVVIAEKAGHSASELPVQQELVKAVRTFE